MYVYIYIYIYFYVYVCTYIYICMCVYVCLSEIVHKNRHAGKDLDLSDPAGHGPPDSATPKVLRASYGLNSKPPRSQTPAAIF